MNVNICKGSSWIPWANPNNLAAVYEYSTMFLVFSGVLVMWYRAGEDHAGLSNLKLKDEN